MIPKCPKCGGTARRNTERISFLDGCASQIVCTRCGNATSICTAFWASDAAEKADREWKNKR